MRLLMDAASGGRVGRKADSDRRDCGKREKGVCVYNDDEVGKDERIMVG